MTKIRDSIEDLRSIATVDDAQTFTADQSHADNVKAKFGASDDLQIYYDGANSLIVNDTNSLVIQNKSDDKQVIIQSDNGGGGLGDYFRADGATGETTLYHYGTAKIATKSTGVDVTGTVTADGIILGDGTTNEIPISWNQSSSDFSIGANGTAFIIANHLTDLDSNQLVAIKDNGNVGIGVVPKNVNGYTALEVKDAYLGSSGSSDLEFGANVYYSSGWKYRNTLAATIVEQYNGQHLFKVAPSGTADSAISWTTAMTINNSGNLLVGTTSGLGSNRVTIRQTGATDVLGLQCTGSDYTHKINFYAASGAVVGYVGSSPTSTSYNTSSDYRLKEADVPMTGATERVKALRPINFAWKFDGSRVDGFFAHELAEVVPEAATGTKDAMMDEEYEVTPAVVDEEGVETTAAVMGTRSVPDMQGIDQSKLVPLLTATIQELIARIEALESGV